MTRAEEATRVRLGVCLGHALLGAIVFAIVLLSTHGWHRAMFGGVAASSLSASVAAALVFWVLQKLRSTPLGFVTLCVISVFAGMSVLEFVWPLNSGSESTALYVDREFHVFIAVIWGGVFGMQGWSAQCAGRDFFDWRVRWTLTKPRGGAG